METCEHADLTSKLKSQQEKPQHFSFWCLVLPRAFFNTLVLPAPKLACGISQFVSLICSHLHMSREA